jgi:hypothetical protein
MLPDPIMENQHTARLKALWKSGRDKYRSFYTVLGDVRKEIGDEALAEFCLKELQIGLSVITNTANVLIRVDSEAVRTELAEANRIERIKAKKKRESRMNSLEKKKDLEKKLKKYRKLPKARTIVRPLIEKDIYFDSKVLEKEHDDISHATFETAKAVELSVMLERLKNGGLRETPS